MAHTIHLEYQIDPIWDIVKQIRKRVGAALTAYPEELRLASQMTASELIENAVKYGSGISTGAGISFDLTATEDQIMIAVSNRILTQEDYVEVQRHLARLNAPGASAEALYLERLQVLLAAEHSEEKTQLGLYRIAYEGQFSLDYRYAQDILTMIAVREVYRAEGSATSGRGEDTR